jgi:hypothetical protein
MPRTFAYVRVSTTGQTTDNQLGESAAAGFTIECCRNPHLSLKVTPQHILDIGHADRRQQPLQPSFPHIRQLGR